MVFQRVRVIGMYRAWPTSPVRSSEDLAARLRYRKSANLATMARVRPRDSRRAIATLLSTSAVFFFARDVGAQAQSLEPYASFSWKAPSECPTEANLVPSLLAAVRRGPVKERVTATAVVDGQGDRWRAELTMSAGTWTSTRAVDGDTCRGVADAVLLIVALAVNPSADEASPALPAPPPPTPPTPPPLPAPAVVTPLPVALPRPAKEVDKARIPPPAPANEPRRGKVHVGVSFVVDGSTLPTVGFGAEVMGGWAFSRLNLDLATSFLAPESATLAADASQGARIESLELRGRACYALLKWGVFTVAPCAGGGVQWLIARGFGATQGVASATDEIAVATLGVPVLARISRHFGLHLAVEAVIPFTRPTFTIVNAGSVYQSAAVSVRTSVGVDLHF